MPGLQWHWKRDFGKELSYEALAIHLQHTLTAPSFYSCMQLYPINGAVQHVGEHDTAFAYRDVPWSLVISGVGPEPANKARITDWAKDYWAALQPYSAGGGYVNFMMHEDQDGLKAAYRGNYDRLVEVKTKYDPDNLLHVNQNIRPEHGTNPRALHS